MIRYWLNRPILAIVALGAVSGLAIADHHTGTAASGYEGRIALYSKLDEPDGLCIDIPGPPFRPFLDWPAWVHTCKPGDVSDMVFRFAAAASGPIMSTRVETTVCLTANALAVGEGLLFAECKEGSPRQTFSYLENGQLQMTASSDKDPELCLAAQTAEAAPMGQPPNNDDPNGHSKVVNLERSHVARIMELRDCSTVSLEVSQWEPHHERPLRSFSH